MWNKLTSLVLIFCLLFVPMIAMADEPLLPPRGRILGIKAGQKAPYTGVLLNSIAAAKLLTDKKFSEEQWTLRIEYEVGKERAKLNLTIQSQKASMEALKDKHLTLMKIKNDEIERLSKIAANTNDYSMWWAAGGIVVGIGLTIAVVYAVDAGNK